MGYISQVAFVIEKSTFEEILTKLNNIDQDEIKELATEYEDQFLIKYDHVKWYPEYELVKVIKSIHPDKIHFLRFGEDYDDYEERGNLIDKFNLCFTREITHS
jgi:hypothetical protein